MKAIIRFGLPPIGNYYNLPIFDSNPTAIFGLGWEHFYYQEGVKVENRYILTFRQSNVEGIFEQIKEWYNTQCPKLLDYQIHKINELYFHMLDNPTIVEGEVEL